MSAAKSAHNLVCERLARSHKGFVQDPYRRSTGVLAGIEFPIHPQMLRHAKGYQLASKGIDTRAIQAYFGHKNIHHTVAYTKLDPSRLKGFGKDL